jgi:hypothetical protein
MGQLTETRAVDSGKQIRARSFLRRPSCAVLPAPSFLRRSFLAVRIAAEDNSH